MKKKVSMEAELDQYLQKAKISHDEINNLFSTLDKLSALREVDPEAYKKISSKFSAKARKLKLQSPKEQATLFPNILPDSTFGMPSVVADTYSQVFDRSTDGTLKYQLVNRAQQLKVDVELEKSKGLAIKYGDVILPIQENEDLASKIKEIIKDAFVLQCLCALWNFASMQDSFEFVFVHIDSILETFNKKPKSGSFRISTKENFSRAIRILEQIHVILYTKETIIRGKKKTKTLSGERQVPLVDFSRTSQFSTRRKKRKKVAQNIEMENTEIPPPVFQILSGRLLTDKQINYYPGKNRARIFPQGIFDLDSRTEGNRILYAFRISTRFSQVNQKPLKWNRAWHIKHAGLEKTDKTNKSHASALLKETFDKFKKLKIIKNYTPKEITTNDGLDIEIFSCIEPQPEKN